MKQSANPADETVCQTRQKTYCLGMQIWKGSVYLFVYLLSRSYKYVHVYLSDETVLQARQMTRSGRPGRWHALADPEVEML